MEIILFLIGAGAIAYFIFRKRRKQSPETPETSGTRDVADRTK